MDCQIKTATNGDMSFTAYGNVKHVVDLALDKAMDGCYAKSISDHKAKGTAPKLLWSHDRTGLPVGKINHLEEDSKGLLFEGKLSKTTMGSDLYILAQDDAINRFSIGYNVVREKWNNTGGYNELHELKINEISFVNFACNDDSILLGVKSAIDDGKLPTVRQLEKILREGGLSRKQAMTICSKYTPDNKQIDLKQLSRYSIFK